MKNISKILALFPNADHIRLSANGFMDLIIERIGFGPRNLPLISVAHYYEQEGDLMRDPEMTFEVHGQNLLPVSFQQDGRFSIYQEAVFKGEQGQVLIRPTLIKQLNSFARTWNANISRQGFMVSAKKQAA